MFEEIFTYLSTRGYEPAIKKDEDVLFIECPYSSKLLNDERLREWVVKGIVNWDAGITEDGLHIVVSIYYNNKPRLYGAQLNITVYHKDGSVDFNSKALADKKSRLECIQSVYADLSEKLKMHAQCVDFSDEPCHQFFEVFDGDVHTLYKYDVFTVS